MNKYIALWLGCIIGSLALIPYLYYLKLTPEDINQFTLILFIQTAVIYGVVIWLSSILVPKTDLNIFNTKGIIWPAIGIGIGVGLLLFALDKWVFSHSALAGFSPPPVWAGAIASLYGAFNEEVLLRLFLFTLLYFLISKMSSQRMVNLWVTNVIVAVVFGLSHLPTALKFVSPSAFEVTRIVLGNAIPGLAFGWLYFTRGIYAAMIAHFVTDIIIHALII